MKTLKLLLLSLSFIGIIVSPGLASADVNDFVVTSFKADESLTRHDRQGELRVVENINVNFSDYNHGLLRAIPDRYKNHSLQMHVNRITSGTYAPTSFTTYGSNGNTVIKIGDAARTVTGTQQYTIDYTLRNVISFYDDHDELYWDVNGDQWDQTFQHVAVNLHLPSELKTNHPTLCYAGSYQSTATDCAIATNANNINIATTKALGPKQTLTYVVAFQKGYFAPATWYQTVGEYAKPLISFFVPLLLLGGGSIIYWYRKGRDPQGSGIIVAQYDAPDGLKPIAVGALVDFKADNRDITATMIDLAIRGYIKIIETKDKKILKDKTLYQLELLNDDFSLLDANEATVTKALFGGKPAGTIVDMASLKSKLYTTAAALSKQVSSQLTDAGYFKPDSLKACGKMTVVVLAIFIVAYFSISLFGWALISGLVVGGAIAIICANALTARTTKGVSAKEHALGLKLYLNVAEKDRIAKLQSPNAPYATNAGEPVKTVELFEKLLPYAMVLGVEKQWAKQFEGLYNAQPDWYGGNFQTFSAIYLVDSLNSGVGSAINTAFSAPSSSGGSGSGGGFSGGGGGGGGGGGW